MDGETSDLPSTVNPGTCGEDEIWCHVVKAITYLADWIVGLVKWIFGFIETIVAKILESILTFVGEMLNSALAPLAGWVADAAGAFGGVAASVQFFIAPFQIGYGVAAVLGAYGVRFLIRRIPFIG